MQELGRIAPRGRERAFRRRCERSEAIHSFFTRRDGLLRFARNDGAGLDCFAALAMTERGSGIFVEPVMGRAFARPLCFSQ